jgi:hypothetical protein
MRTIQPRLIQLDFILVQTPRCTLGISRILHTGNCHSFTEYGDILEGNPGELEQISY